MKKGQQQQQAQAAKKGGQDSQKPRMDPQARRAMKEKITQQLKEKRLRKVISQTRGSSAGALSSVGGNSTDAESQKALSLIKQVQGAKDDSIVPRNYDKNLLDSDDSSDEEVLLRTGNVPRRWYELYDHQGYDVKGKKVAKMPEQDELEKFIERQNDPQWWRKITDDLNNRNVKLSKADLELIQRVRSGQFADKDLDPFDFQIEFEHKEMIHPFNSDEPKRRFQPSKWERLKVSKIVQALKKGWMKTLAEKAREREEQEKEKIWDIWQDDSVVTWRPRKMPKAIAAPKRDLPIHAESYNPPEEYILDENEKEEFVKKDPEDRPYNFLPQKFEALRKVPLYQDLIREHFERCLDLYLCPRVLKKKVHIEDPSKLIPELPQPSDLKPFPTSVSIEYKFHTTCVRSISVSPCGQYLASGDEDGNLVIWHLQTTRILRKYKLDNKIIDCVEWNPNKERSILTATNEEIVYVINPGLYTRDVNSSTSDLIEQAEKNYNQDVLLNDKKEQFWKWSFAADVYGRKMIKITFQNIIKTVVWHSKGDYFATMAQNVQSSTQVVIHSLSKSNSQRPFTQAKGIVQAMQFHPTKPHFLIATHQTVFQYNLQKQSMVTKYQSGAKWISSLSVHPKGDNFILGTYDKKIIWFDMDMGSSPYKNLKYHDKAIRQVQYSPKYPLFASSSDDGSVNVFYGMVFNDLLQNALIVPVKILKAHPPNKASGLGAMDCKFHPTQPWIFTCGSEGTIKLWV